MFVKVTGTNLIRDTESMAISNTDQAEKNEYYNKVRMVKLQNEKINRVSEEVSDVRKDLDEIKLLLTKLLETKQ